VAITFTEAAAAEMAERVAEALHDLGHGCAVIGVPQDGLPGEARSRALVLLAAVDQMEVRTIHSWCRRLLVQFPIEAGIHPSFDLDTDEDLLQRVVRDATEDHLTTMLAGDQAAALLRLFELDGNRGPADIERAVISLLRESTNPEVLAVDPWDQGHLDALWLRVRNLVSSTLDLVGDALEGVSRVKNGQKLCDGLLAFRDVLEPGARMPDVQSALAEYLPSNLVAHLSKAWVKRSGGQGEMGALEHIADPLARVADPLHVALKCLAELDEEGHTLARTTLLPIMEAAHSTLRARGVLVFADLLAKAAELLKNRSVAARVRAGIDQLMVDEFQDTDPRQCDLVRAIALEGDLGARPGLFIVGDPKQSIYGWRSADLRAYEQFVGEVVEAGGVEHGLIQNFRSTAGILDEVDRCMVGLLRPQPGVQPAHESLVAARGPGRDEPQVEHWVSWAWEDGTPATSTPAERAREIEASAIARDILRLQDEGVSLSEVGLLFRAASAMNAYQTALRDHGIPYEVTRDKNYFKRREVVEAAAMLRAILDPADTLALVSFLRSGMVNVPDAALIPLFAEGFPGHWLRLGAIDPSLVDDCIDRASARAQNSEPHVPGLAAVAVWSAQLKHVTREVATLRLAFETLGFENWLEEVRARLLPDVVGAVAYQGIYRVANLERLFRTLADRMGRVEGDVQAVLRSLRQAVRDRRDEEEGRPSGARNAVSMMTIHKSKGLAFSHTYIVDLHHTSRGRPDGLATTCSPDFGLQLMGFKHPNMDLVMTREAEVQRAETSRLLYVGMTRARDRLVLAGLWQGPLRGLDRPRFHLDLFGERTPELPHPDDLWGHLAESEDTVDDSGIRWFFPGRRVVESVAQNPLSSVLVTGGRSTSVAERIGSIAHAQRPWSMGPSAATTHEVTPGKGGGRGVSRTDAFKVGEAIHKLMEWAACGRVDFSESTVRTALTLVQDETPLSDAGLRRALTLARQVEGGHLLTYLAGVEVIGTEVPLLMSPSDGGPVAAWTGSIDLLYRCPETGAVVVADHKTDRIGDRKLEEVARHHAPQGLLYAEAVQRALGLPDRPRFEVWLIEADARVVVD